MLPEQRYYTPKSTFSTERKLPGTVIVFFFFFNFYLHQKNSDFFIWFKRNEAPVVFNGFFHRSCSLMFKKSWSVNRETFVIALVRENRLCHGKLWSNIEFGVLQCLACWVKISRWHFELFLLFSTENSLCHDMRIVSTICIKCLSLFSWNNN